MHCQRHDNKAAEGLWTREELTTAQPTVGQRGKAVPMQTLKIKCVWGAYLKEPFGRTLEVPDEMTLGELHDEIQRVLPASVREKF